MLRNLIGLNSKYLCVSQQGSRYKSSLMAGKKCLNVTNINPYMEKVEYAVRGPILELANKLQDELNRGVSKPYKRIVKANIGDCHATGQKSITFFRQVLAACSNPDLFTNPGLFPEDVEERARQIINSAHGSIGCYSDSLGCEYIRKQVAKYIENRDGFECDFNNVYLTNGASSAIKMVLYSLMSNKTDSEQSGIMIPIPQYPLYSATIAELGGYMMKYYLDEDNNWGLNIDQLEQVYQNESTQCTPRAIVIINPGNPTGQVLPYENIVGIIDFAKKHNLLILADEVYQENIYTPNIPFHSFKKVLCELGAEYNDVELISFHSASKGYYGECGIRGGYMELFRIDDGVQKQYNKLMSTNLGSNLCGQVIISCIASIPEVGQESYSLFKTEKDTILDQLNKKATMVYKYLNSMEGISCNQVLGALYAFPQLHLTTSAIDAAKASNMKPDTFYCMNLLKEKGICVVPGNGFGQKDNTYHFRMTILPSIADMNYMLDAINDFNTNFRATFK